MKRSVDEHRYDDMLDMPHHVSSTRPRMPVIDRAAQFSPFAALTGYDSAIEETGRLTEQRMDLDESRIEMLDEKLQMIQRMIKENERHPAIRLTYFRPDERKAGGSYCTFDCTVKKIDVEKGVIRLNDHREIPINQIYEIESNFAPMHPSIPYPRDGH